MLQSSWQDQCSHKLGKRASKPSDRLYQSARGKTLFPCTSTVNGAREQCVWCTKEFILQTYCDRQRKIAKGLHSRRWGLSLSGDWGTYALADAFSLAPTQRRVCAGSIQVFSSYGHLESTLDYAKLNRFCTSATLVDSSKNFSAFFERRTKATADKRPSFHDWVWQKLSPLTHS